MDKYLTEGKREDTIKGVKALISDVNDFIKRKRNTYEVEPEFLSDMISMMKQRGHSLSSVERDIEAEAKKLSRNLDSTFMKISTQTMQGLINGFSKKYGLSEDEKFDEKTTVEEVYYKVATINGKVYARELATNPGRPGNFNNRELIEFYHKVRKQLVKDGVLTSQNLEVKYITANTYQRAYKKRDIVSEDILGEAYTEKQKQDILDKNTVFDKLPSGWSEIKNATTAPRGYVWISNGKSILSKDRKIALIKVENLK